MGIDWKKARQSAKKQIDEREKRKEEKGATPSPSKSSNTTNTSTTSNTSANKGKKLNWESAKRQAVQRDYERSAVARNANTVLTTQPTQTVEEPRDATLVDLLWNSAKRGYYNSRYGEELYDQMMGHDNDATKYEQMLSGDDYNFEADGWIGKAVSGAAELLGQQARQWSNPLSLGMAGTAATAAAIAGQAGPQVLAPEEVFTVPGAAIAGLQAGSTKANFEIEAGHAYKEMIDNGVSAETAKKIALGVGAGNAALEFVQLDELVKSFKVLDKVGADDAFKDIVKKEIARRGVSVAKETAQEVAQEGVTMYGVQKATEMDTGKGAFTTKDVVERLGDTAVSSALSFGVMNVPGGVHNTVSQTKTQKDMKAATERKNQALDLYLQDDETITALIQEGKEMGADSASEQIANEIEAKRASGHEVTRADVERLVKSNESYIQRMEAPVEAQDAIESLARESVARETKIDQREAVPQTDAVQRSATLEQAVKRETGYGSEGAKAFSAILEQSEDGNVDALRSRFQASYELGLTDAPKARVTFDNPIQEAAFDAGKRDYILSLSKAEPAVTAHVKAGLDASGDTTNLPKNVKPAAMPKDVTEAQVKTADAVAKALGVRVRMVSGLKGNAQINGDEVLIDENFQRKVGGSDRSLVFYVAHEIAGHRTAQLAPKEWRAFQNAMIQAQNEGLPAGVPTVSEKRQAEYASQDVNISLEGAMEEVGADSILGLYENEDDFYRAVNRIANVKDAEAKSGARKFLASIREVIRKVKVAISKLTGKEKTEAKQVLTEVEQLRDKFEAALKGAVDSVDMKVNRILTDAETDKILRDAGVEPMKRQGGALNLEKLGIKAGETGQTEKYSLKDSEGNALTKEQQEYFKDSKVRDEDGNLKVMYHGSQEAGFHTFKSYLSKDSISFFFTDNNTTAKSYSGTHEQYAAKSFRTAEDLNKFFEEIGERDYEVVERDGAFYLLDDGDEVAESDSAAGIYSEFQDWAGIGRGGANYKTYLNITNPLVVEAEGNNWDELPPMDSVRDKYSYIKVLETGKYDDMVKIEYQIDGEAAPKTEYVNLYEKFESGTADRIADLAPGESVKNIYTNPTNTRDYARFAKANGYDGVIFRRVIDNGMYASGMEQYETSTVAVAFSPEQIKSTENKRPTTDQDIRYSLRTDSEGNQLTEQQEEYFRDSKVRDKQGRLLKVYHGTGNEFTVFDKKRIGQNFPGRGGDMGFYFTPYKEDANEYAWNASGKKNGGSVMSVYLNLKNPLVVEDDGWGSAIRQADIRHNDLMRWAKQGGHDGIIVVSTDEEMSAGEYDSVYIAFSEEQIKNTDNLNPTSDPDIRYSLKEYSEAEKRDHVKTALEHFGKTYKWAETGYLTPNGTKLDFSGRHEGAPGGYRTVDHRDIRDALGDDYGGEDYSGGMVQFMGEGNIRISPESSGINLSVKPTKAQMDALSDFISRARGEVILDIDDTSGRTLSSTEYPRGTHANKVLEDIRRYFDSGEKPYVSELAQFRWSLRANEDILKENAKLKEVNQDLRGQLKRTEFAKVDRKQLDKFAKQLLRDYESGADINDTRKALDDLYTYIANGEDGMPPAWNEVQKRAYETAVSILEDSSSYDDSLYQSYKGLRDRLRTSGMTIDPKYNHDLMGYESINDFRKANMGRIKLVKDGTPVDMVYSELASTYPEFFDEQEYSTQPDQLSHIAEVLDSLRPIEVNPYSTDMRNHATWMANDIIERFFDLPQAKPTFADKAEQKLTQQVIKDAKKLEQVKEKDAQRLASLREQNARKLERERQKRREQNEKILAETREKIAALRVKEREKRENQVAAVKERYKAKEAKGRETRKARELRERIMKHASDLSEKLVRPSDKHHIPEHLKGPVAAMLDAINLESNYTYDPFSESYKKNDDGLPTRRTRAFEDVRRAYKKILEDESTDMVLDPSLELLFEDVTAMRDIRIADMTSSQLQTIWDLLKMVEHSIYTAGKVLSSSKYKKTTEWAYDFKDETSTKKSKTGKQIESLRLDLENPYTFFSHYGKAGKAVFRMLRDAQDKQQDMVVEVREAVREIVAPKTVKALENETHDFVTAGGKELTLTTAHIMEIYELMKRQQANDHLLKGGIVQPEVKVNGKKIERGTDAILLNPGDIVKITKVLTKEQRAIADAMQKLTTTILADYGNEASMAAYGYKKFTGKDYWPIKSASEGIHSNVEKGGSNTRSIKNIGMAKSVMPHASNPLDIGGLFKTFSDHAADMIDYGAWLLPMEDANRLFNFKFRDEQGNFTGEYMKSLLDRVGGKGAQKYWHNLMEDIQNGINASSDSFFIPGINKVIGNVRAASVGANVRVIIQQPTAILRAATVLSPADMAKGMTGGVLKGDGWKKALEHSAIAKRKDMGGFDISSPAQMSEILYDNGTKLQKFNEAMMWGASKADAITWGAIWNACEWAVKREKPSLQGQAFIIAVNEKFTDVIDQSQVVDGVLQRSQTMRSGNALVKQATAFMGEPTMALNMVLRAYDAYASETDPASRTKAKKALGRTVEVLLITNVVNALAQSVVDGLRDDDDEKDYWERVIAAFTGDWEDGWTAVLTGNAASSVNPMGYVPFAKDILSILQGYNVTRADADVMADMMSAVQEFAKSLTGEGKKTIPYATKNLAQQVGKMFGISATNLLRDVWGMMRTIAIETDSVEVQYEMEKAINKISHEDNTAGFVDILFRAYDQGSDSYEHIYDDMVKNGVSEEKIAKAMESRMKKAQGVKEVEGLEQRYLSPSKQKQYDKKLGAMRNSGVWNRASASQRDEAESRLYDLVEQNSAGEDLLKDISDGAAYGLNETDYLLYKLALDMVDQPNKSGELGGTPTNEEKAAAIQAVGGLSNSEIAFLWDTDSGYDAYAAGVDMAAYVDYLGEGGSVSTDKLIAAQEAGIGTDTYIDFMETLKEVDQPTKGGNYGSFTQDEAAEAIRAMPGLTREERAYLWQSVNKSWKSNKNPWR